MILKHMKGAASSFVYELGRGGVDMWHCSCVMQSAAVVCVCVCVCVHARTTAVCNLLSVFNSQLLIKWEPK